MIYKVRKGGSMEGVKIEGFNIVYLLFRCRLYLLIYFYGFLLKVLENDNKGYYFLMNIFLKKINLNLFF